MVYSSRESRHLGSQLTAESYNFESINEFIYLSTVVTGSNNVSLEIKRSTHLPTGATVGSLSTDEDNTL